MFSVLSSVDLFSDRITTAEHKTRSDSSQDLAKIFASVYGLPESTFSDVFKYDKILSKTTLNKNAFLNLIVNNFSNGSSSASAKAAPLNFGEAELFFDLFSTVYFMQGSILDEVFSVTILDKTVGVLYSTDDFSNSPSSPNVSKFDTYNVSAQIDTPIFNSIL